MSEYGFCPICGQPGKLRERGIRGHDYCVNGHKYLSSAALDRIADVPVPTLFISAPYAGASPAERQLNVQRAAALAHLAVVSGWAPLLVHTDIEAGVYGSDANPSDRERGLRICRSLLRSATAVWTLLRDDRSLAAGQQYEQAGQTPRQMDLTHTWDGWRVLFDVHQLSDVWERLQSKRLPEEVAPPRVNQAIEARERRSLSWETILAKQERNQLESVVEACRSTPKPLKPPVSKQKGHVTVWLGAFK